MSTLYDRPEELVPLDLSFKGARGYLHGTDMVDALSKLAPGLTDISLRILKIAEKPLAAMLVSGTESSPAQPAAILRARRDSEKIVITLVESNSDLPLGRYDYNEEDVVGRASIDPEERIADMPWNDQYSPIEQIVTLHKTLLMRCFADSGVQWYFSRLDVPRFPRVFGKMSLSVTQALGTSLIRSGIAVDGKPFGNIYFSGVKK